MEAVILITREKDGLKIAGVLKDNYQLKEADFCFNHKTYHGTFVMFGGGKKLFIMCPDTSLLSHINIEEVTIGFEHCYLALHISDCPIPNRSEGPICTSEHPLFSFFDNVYLFHHNLNPGKITQWIECVKRRKLLGDDIFMDLKRRICNAIQ